MTSALQVVSPKMTPADVNPFYSEFRQNLNISNRNIAKISKANFASDAEKFGSAQKLAQDRIKNIHPSDIVSEEKSEQVAIESKTAIDELKSLIDEENRFITKNSNQINKNENKQIAKTNPNINSDINEGGFVDFGKSLNRAQGIINSVASSVVKQETDDLKSSKQSEDIKIDSVDSNKAKTDNSILKQGERTGKDLLNNDKNKNSKDVEKEADDLKKRLNENKHLV